MDFLPLKFEEFVSLILQGKTNYSQQCAPCHGGSLICTSKGFGFIMVRYRERKTNRGKTPVEVMRTAVDEVLKKNRAINAVARETGIDRMTLKRYVRKSSLSPSVGLIPNWNTRQKVIHYIGQIISEAGDLMVKYLKREKMSSFNFICRNDELYQFIKEDIVCKVPDPIQHGGTARAILILSYEILLG
ncbi:hypothetical protein HELRODRAFT_171668 [Helobdella robusta]|uniref:Cytochrome c domain-containing protein n=1 Tax=Helobdella robusta TaxID=6412 RepID=T1F4J1_HELRO|nr:hypothetical protein HELRODRAFT_171668 [Helobdella robusta]ESO05302.1 hypothetical protein HELRODRAFT_171668 [Helobdella robusta]